MENMMCNDLEQDFIGMQDTVVYSELQRAGLLDEDSDYHGMIGTAVLSLLNVLYQQEHSGGSIGITLYAFGRLAQGLTLTPITGDDDEWNDVSAYDPSSAPIWQNKRCSAIFKDSEKAWYLNKIHLVRPDYSILYPSIEEQVVTFPYMPNTEQRLVDMEGNPVSRERFSQLVEEQILKEDDTALN